jgi:hypothetical protein
MSSLLGRAGWSFWLAWLLLSWALPVRAQEPAVVRVEPPALALAPGETAVLAVVVERAAGVFGYEVRLAFDPALIQVVDADSGQPGVQVRPGGFLDPARGFTAANQADNEAGLVDYAFTLLAPSEPVSGAGVLLTLTVRAAAAGSSPLALSVVLASRDGLALPLLAEDGELTVTGDPQPVATQPAGTAPTATAPAPAADVVSGPTATPPSGFTPSPSGSAAGPFGAVTSPAQLAARVTSLPGMGPVPELTQRAATIAGNGDVPAAQPDSEATLAAVERTAPTEDGLAASPEQMAGDRETIAAGAGALSGTRTETGEARLPPWAVAAGVLALAAAALLAGRRLLSGRRGGPG